MRSDAITHETPWLATVADGKLHLNNKQGYDQWIAQSFGDGERAMVLVLPLASDQARFHANVYRYWRNVVLPLIAEEIGEANLDTAHDVVVAQLTGVRPAPRRRKGLKLQRKSTAMDAMPCAELCDIVDRAVIWAQVDLNITVPMSDPDWKWRKHFEELQDVHRRGAVETQRTAVGVRGRPKRLANTSSAGTEPVAAPADHP